MTNAQRIRLTVGVALGTSPPASTASTNADDDKGRFYFGSGTATSRTDTVTVTSGSATVLDASCIASDTGRAVSGVGIPGTPGVFAGMTFIGTVTAGTSFKLSSSDVAQVDVLATSNGTSALIQGGLVATIILGGNYSNIVDGGSGTVDWHLQETGLIAKAMGLYIRAVTPIAAGTTVGPGQNILLACINAPAASLSAGAIIVGYRTEV